MIGPVRPGDLILYRLTKSSNWLDRLIGWGQRAIHQAPSKASYCHVAIVGPDIDHLYEAVWPKFHNTVFDPTATQKSLIIEIYRVRGATDEQITKVMAACEKLVGEWYPVISILTFGLITMGHSPYCSQGAWEAWLSAGTILCSDEIMISPDDIAASIAIIRVE